MMGFVAGRREVQDGGGLRGQLLALYHQVLRGRHILAHDAQRDWPDQRPGDSVRI